MHKVLIVKNISREGPGILAQVLDTEHIPFDVIDLEKLEALPSIDDYDAVVVLGGPDSANDQTAKMLHEIAWVQNILQQGTPYLGICLGLQIAVKAAGGRVIPGNSKEVGLLDPEGNQNEIIAENGEDPLLSGLGKHLKVFQLHGETVILTNEMKLLASGKYCRNQIVKINPTAYGIQSHFELTTDMLLAWANEDPDLMPLGKDALLKDFTSIQDTYTTIGKALFYNFLRIAKLVV